MVNNSLSNKPRQAKYSTDNEKDFTTYYPAVDTLQAVIKTQALNSIDTTLEERDLLKVVLGLTKGDRKFLDSLLLLQSRHRQVWIGFERLADITGYCSKTMKRASAKLIRMGIISKISGSYTKANEYKLHPLFSSLTYRAQLANLLPAIRYLPTFMVFSIGLLLSVPVVNVPANYICNNLRSSSSSISISKDVRTRTKGSVPTASFFQKGREGESMIQQLKEQRMHESEKAINGIRTLKLTVWGKIVLAAYPAEAIRYADGEIYMRRKLPTNPLGLFKSLCLQFCEKNGLKPDWDRVDHLKTIVPWETGHYEVTDNVVHQNHWVNQQILAEAKPYLPGKEWDLKKQHKEIRKPINGNDIAGVRLPAWTMSEDQKERNKIVAVAEIDKAIAQAQSTGKMNPFLALMTQSAPPVVEATPAPALPSNPFMVVLAATAAKMEKDVLNTIKTVSGDVERYKERKEIPTAWELSNELAVMDNDSPWEEIEGELL